MCSFLSLLNDTCRTTVFVYFAEFVGPPMAAPAATHAKKKRKKKGSVLTMLRLTRCKCESYIAANLAFFFFFGSAEARAALSGCASIGMLLHS